MRMLLSEIDKVKAVALLLSCYLPEGEGGTISPCQFHVAKIRDVP